MLQMERRNVNLTELVCRFSPKEDIAPHRNKNISSCPVVCECACTFAEWRSLATETLFGFAPQNEFVLRSG